jgi:hypothetical protein
MPKLCEFENCRRQASYGEFYGKQFRCNLHKENYVLVCRLCKQGNCRTRPTYNYEGEKMGAFCDAHKLEGMINVRDKKCIHEGCKTLPSYNFEGETKALYCFFHKSHNMIDVKHRRCKHDGCNIRPNYNYKNETIGLYCVSHKLEGMVDINHSICKYEGCELRPIYNYQGQTTRKYCINHKLEGMINVVSKKCQYEGCNIIPNYNFKGKTNAIYCVSHKSETMVDIRHKPCKANFCLGSRGNVKYKGYCATCFQNLFPNDPLSFQFRSKTKEIAVRDYINSTFQGFQHDTTLWTGNCNCTHRRRIDHRKLINDTLLCIETDEYQHKFYDKNDEEIRYDDLFMLHGGKFIYIRFNPDKYKNKHGKTCNPMLYNRLLILKQEIERQILRINNEENTELLEIVKLYYDEELEVNI